MRSGSMRLASLFLVLAVAGCDRAPPSPSPPEPAPRIVAASASAPPPAVEAPDKDLIPADESRAAFEQILKALDVLPRDKAQARAELRKLGNFCVGQAGLAYLAWDAGELDAAAAHLARAKAMKAGCLSDATSPLGEQVSSAFRFGLDEVRNLNGADDRAALPCAVFEAHPREAFAAAAPYWGSTLDLPALLKERECALAAIAGVTPANQANRAERALMKAGAASFKVAHQPSGTMWISRTQDIANGIARALIAPELLKADPGLDARLEAAIARAEPHVKGIRPRLLAFNSVRTAEAPVLGDVICGRLAKRAAAVPREECHLLANEAIKRALATWLAQEPWEGIFLEGGGL